MTTNASTTTSAAIPPKVGRFGDMHCDNLQSANGYALVLFFSPKSVSSNEIPSSKADLSAPSIMPKFDFIEKVDDDDNDTNFEPASCIHVISTEDNQIHQSVMGRNIIGPPNE